jgi:hypothetical protein
MFITTLIFIGSAHAATPVDTILGFNGKVWDSAPTATMTCRAMTNRMKQCVEPKEMNSGVRFQGIAGVSATYGYFDEKLVSFTIGIDGLSAGNKAIKKLDVIFGAHETERYTYGWPGRKVQLSILQGDGSPDGHIGAPSTPFWMLTAGSTKYQSEMASHMGSLGY